MSNTVNAVHRKYYGILEVPPNATADEIKRSYRRLALKYHPDKNHALQANQKFVKINAAYRVLSDPEKRLLYDQFGDAYDQIRQNSLLGYIIVDVLALAFVLISTPLDTISTRAKTTIGSNPVSWTIFRIIKQNEGLKGFWSGFTLNISNSLADIHLRRFFGVDLYTSSFFALLLRYPLEVLFTCVRTKATTSGWDGCKEIYRTAGLKGFYSGLLVIVGYHATLTIASLVWEISPINQRAQKYLKAKQEKKKFNELRAGQFLLGFLKTLVINFVACPVQTVAVRMQIQALTGTARVMTAIRSIIAEEGISKLWSGFVFDSFNLGLKSVLNEVVRAIS